MGIYKCYRSRTWSSIWTYILVVSAGFRKNDPICRNRCAVNLRCAIEHGQNERFEVLDDLVSMDSMVIKVN